MTMGTDYQLLRTYHILQGAFPSKVGKIGLDTPRFASLIGTLDQTRRIENNAGWPCRKIGSGLRAMG